MVQLLLCAEHGWEDISASGVRADDLQRRGFFALVVLVSCSQLVRLCYEPQLGTFSAMAAVVAVAGGMLGALFVGRLMMGAMVCKWVDERTEPEKVHVLTLYGLGLTGLYRLVYNLIPTPMMLLKLLPLLSLLVFIHATTYLGVPQDKGSRLVGIGAVCVILLPWVITSVFMMFI